MVTKDVLFALLFEPNAFFWDVRLALDGRLLGALDIVESCFLGAVMRSDAATVGWEGRAVK